VGSRVPAGSLDRAGLDGLRVSPLAGHVRTVPGDVSRDAHAHRHGSPRGDLPPRAAGTSGPGWDGPDLRRRELGRPREVGARRAAQSRSRSAPILRSRAGSCSILESRRPHRSWRRRGRRARRWDSFSPPRPVLPRSCVDEGTEHATRDSIRRPPRGARARTSKTETPPVRQGQSPPAHWKPSPNRGDGRMSHARKGPRDCAHPRDTPEQPRFSRDPGALAQCSRRF